MILAPAEESLHRVGPSRPVCIWSGVVVVVGVDSDQREVLQDDAKLILPIYIAVDHSWSMGPDQNDAIDAANSLIPTIIKTCKKHPIADERARFCIIGFNDTAKVVSPMARGSNLGEHTFEASRGTSYSAVFKLLKSQIESDYAAFRADDFKTHRPAIFLITDGEPLDDPSSAFAALTDESNLWRPNLSVFGIGPDVTQELADKYKSGTQGRGFVTKNETDAATELEGIVTLLMSSVIASTAAAPGQDDPDDGGWVWDDDDIEDADFLLET